MFRADQQNPLNKLFELVKQNEANQIYFLIKDHSKEDLAKLAIDVYQQMKKENDSLKTKINELNLQLQSKSNDNNNNNNNTNNNNNNNNNSEIEELKIDLSEANKRYEELYKKYEQSFQQQQEVEKQIKNVENMTNEYIKSLKQQKEEIQQQLFKIQKDFLESQTKQEPKFLQNEQYQKEFDKLRKCNKDITDQCEETIKNIKKAIEDKEKNNEDLEQYQQILATSRQVREKIENMVQQYQIFKQESKIKDPDIIEKLENNMRVFQMNSYVMKQFENVLIKMFNDRNSQEKKSKRLVQEYEKLNNLNEKIKKENQEEIDKQNLIIQSLKQKEKLETINNKNNIFTQFNRLKSIQISSNDYFYEILLQFVSQGLTIANLQLKLQNQNEIIDISTILKEFMKSYKPTNFKQIGDCLEKFKQYCNQLKQYITDQNKLIDVFSIQDKFFINYQKAMEQLQEIEKIQNMIDQVITPQQR